MRYSESKHFDSRFKTWLTDRFDYVYENLEVETFIPDYNKLNDMQNDIIEESIDAIDVIERWKEDNTTTFNLRPTE